ncbi:MAG: hypothetical protein P4M09_03015 [Devosia sp.]|nr:hypothetical protein [Devosia sp.]
MPVKYITVTPQVDLFVPATRSFGNIAIVGTIDPTAQALKKIPIAITNPLAVTAPPQALTTSAATATGDTTLTFAAVPATIVVGMEVSDLSNGTAVPDHTTVQSTTATTVVLSQAVAGVGVASGEAIQFVNAANGLPVDDVGWFKGPLGASIKTAFAQAPGPTTIWGIATDSADGANELANGLAAAAKLAVQIVVLAQTPLIGAGAGQGKEAIEALAAHCNTVSTTGADGMERIGVAMLGKGVTDTTIVSSAMAQNRMTMVAHHSNSDAAAAMAGAIAGQAPHISMLLKQIALDMDEVFADSEIDAFNTARINWLTRTPLIPGAGFYLGEGYTLGADQPYIDIVRTIDKISFDLKAALIRSIGVLRVTRSGLRALASEMSAVLQPLQDDGVIDSYLVFFPLLTLLDKDPSKLADVELQQIHNAQATRSVNSIVTVEYAGAVHRLNITLKFE